MEKGRMSFTGSLRESNGEFLRAEVDKKNPEIQTGGEINTETRLLLIISYPIYERYWDNC